MNYFCGNLPDIIESGLKDRNQIICGERPHSSCHRVPVQKHKLSRSINSKSCLSPLEIHRLKQREQYKNMLSSLNELIAILPTNAKLGKNQTKQVVLTECTRYIQYLLVVAWCLANDCHKLEEEILPCLAWDGFCLNEDVLQMLNMHRPLSFKIFQTKRKAVKRIGSKFQNLISDKSEYYQSKISRKRKKGNGKLNVITPTFTNNGPPRKKQTRNAISGTDELQVYSDPTTSLHEPKPGCSSTSKDRLLNSAACVSKSPPPFLNLSQETHQPVADSRMQLSMNDNSSLWASDLIWESGNDDISLLQNTFPLNCNIQPHPAQKEEIFFPPRVDRSIINPECVSPLLESSFYCQDADYYQPQNDHNYGRSHPLAPVFSSSNNGSDQSVLVNLRDVAFTSGGNYDRISMESHYRMSRKSLEHTWDYSEIRKNDYFRMGEQNCKLNTGASGSYMQTSYDLPLDLSLSTHSPPSSQRRVASQASHCPCSTNGQSLEFSPRMFLNILPKPKETRV